MVIDELKAKAGLGGARVKIDLPRGDYRLDESVKGKLLLTGGTVSQKIDFLTISLIREWNWECFSIVRDMDFNPGPGRDHSSSSSISLQTEYELDGGSGREETCRITLGKDITIEPEELKTYPFVIDLSMVQRDEGVSERWKLLARAKIPFAKDARAEEEITFRGGKGE